MHVTQHRAEHVVGGDHQRPRVGRVTRRFCKVDEGRQSRPLLLELTSLRAASREPLPFLAVRAQRLDTVERRHALARQDPQELALFREEDARLLEVEHQHAQGPIIDQQRQDHARTFLGGVVPVKRGRQGAGLLNVKRLVATQRLGDGGITVQEFRRPHAGGLLGSTGTGADRQLVLDQVHHTGTGLQRPNGVIQQGVRHLCWCVGREPAAR